MSPRAAMAAPGPLSSSAGSEPVSSKGRGSRIRARFVVSVRGAAGEARRGQHPAAARRRRLLPSRRWRGRRRPATRRRWWWRRFAELRQRADRHPAGKTFLPDQILAAGAALGDALLDLLQRERPDRLAALDEEILHVSR